MSFITKTWWDKIGSYLVKSVYLALNSLIVFSIYMGTEIGVSILFSPGINHKISLASSTNLETDVYCQNHPLAARSGFDVCICKARSKLDYILEIRG